MNISFFLILTNSLTWSNDMSFFNDSKIDYWNKSKTHTSKKEVPPSSKWKQFLDPNSNEFFKEGNHIPPEPFMELARNPTDENIKNWFALMDAKNKIMSRLQENIQAYMAKNGSYNAQEKQLIETEVKKLNPTTILDGDIKRFRFQLYVDSHCGHCKKMLETMKEFIQLGYYVEIKQIDKEPLGPLPFVLTYASTNEIKQKQITSWPVLFVADTKKEKIYRINGFNSTKDIITKLSSKEIL